MNLKRKLGLAVAATATLVAMSAGPASALTVTSSPDPATPGATVTVTIELGNNCVFDNPNALPHPADDMDIAVYSPASPFTPVATIPSVPIDNSGGHSELSFTFTVPAGTQDFGHWFVRGDEPGVVTGQMVATTADPIGRECQDGPAIFTGANGPGFEVVDPNAPLLPTEMVVGAGLAAVAAGGAYLVHRQRREAAISPLA